MDIHIQRGVIGCGCGKWGCCVFGRVGWCHVAHKQKDEGEKKSHLITKKRGHFERFSPHNMLIFDDIRTQLVLS